MATRAENAAAKRADKRVEQAFYRTCEGVQIDVLDISKVFRVGRAAILDGADDDQLDAVVKSFVQTIRKN